MEKEQCLYLKRKCIPMASSSRLTLINLIPELDTYFVLHLVRIVLQVTRESGGWRYLYFVWALSSTPHFSGWM